MHIPGKSGGDTMNLEEGRKTRQSHRSQNREEIAIAIVA